MGASRTVISRPSFLRLEKHHEGHYDKSRKEGELGIERFTAPRNRCVVPLGIGIR
jgi:hypothetical protein